MKNKRNKIATQKMNGKFEAFKLFHGLVYRTIFLHLVRFLNLYSDKWKFIVNQARSFIAIDTSRIPVFVVVVSVSNELDIAVRLPVSRTKNW